MTAATKTRKAVKDLTLADVKHRKTYTIGALSIPDQSGDTTLMWDTRDEASVAEVRARFDEIVKTNLAYKVTEASGRTGEQIKDFDPEAEHIVVAKRLVGG